MPRISKLSDRQVALFCRGLSLQLHAGIPLADGIHLLAEDEAGECRNLLKQIGTLLDAGAQLSEALKEAGGFPEYVCGMVTVAEQTGKLEQTLQSLCGFYDRQAAQRRQIKNALSYPSMVFALMLLVVGVLLVKVLPVFDRVYGSLGSRLTGPAAGLLYAGQLLEGALPALFILLLVLAAAALALRTFPALREKLAAAWKRRYGDCRLARKFNNARFARAMAMGLSSGLPLERCLSLAEDLLRDVPGAARRCGDCARAVTEGISPGTAMEKAQLLPPAQCRLLQLGHRSGNADRVMEQIADTMTEDAQAALEQVISGIEPAMVLIASLLVGLILLSVMVPLADILSVLG